MTSAPAPTPHGVQYYMEVIGRLADRLSAATAELVMAQVNLDIERSQHAATRAALEEATAEDEQADAPEGAAEGTTPTTRRRRPAGGKSEGSAGGSGEGAPGEA